MNLKNKKILVTGGAGFIGSHVVDVLVKSRGVNKKNIRVPRSKDLDLTVYENARKAVKGMDVVFHLASDVGGSGYSRLHPATQYYQSMILELQILEAAKDEGVEKVVLVSSTCAYPEDAPLPLREEDLFGGLPAIAQDGYGMAKRMAIFMADIYHREYGLNVVTVIPNNAYGPRDDFDLEGGHVIPSIIKKCLEEKELVVWGDGKASRDFFYVEDFAESVVLAMEKLEGQAPVNLGSGTETSIKEIVTLVTKLTNFKGKVTFDRTKPKALLRRSVDVSKAYERMGFKPKWKLEDGLKATIKWYLKNQHGI
jgi:GDP-L-fucose synthase